MAVRSVDDRRLVELHKAGDEDAFTEIVSAYYAQLMSHARRRLRDPRAAEDAVQEAMLRAYRALPRFNGEYRLGAWLHRIVENVCADEGNRRRREGELTDKVMALPAAAETDVATEAIADPEVTEALRNLSPNYRDALVLRYVEGLPYRDVAARTGVSEENARARAHRGRAVLRKMLGNGGHKRGAAALVPGFAAWMSDLLRRGRKAVPEMHPVAAVESAANRTALRVAPAAEHMVGAGMVPGSGMFARAAAVVAVVSLPVASAGIGGAIKWLDRNDEPRPTSAKADPADQPTRLAAPTAAAPPHAAPAAPAPSGPQPAPARARANVAGVDGDTERWDWFGQNPNKDPDADGASEGSDPSGEYVRADALGASAEAGTTRIYGGGEYKTPERLLTGRIEAVLRTTDEKGTGGREMATFGLIFTEEGGRSQPVRVQLEGHVTSVADEGELTRYAVSGTWRVTGSGLGFERSGRFHASMLVGSTDVNDLRVTLEPGSRP